MARAFDLESLLAGARDGQVRSIARLISLVEDSSPLLRPIMAALAPLAGRAMVVGLTGSPGVGKSTTTSALITAYRAAGSRVGVLAVDPTSPFSGGALLGDRIRMQEHATDPGVFIRSMASRGHLGGLAWATPQAIRILDAVGFDVVLVETVGVGQSEVEIAAAADTSVVLLAPGMGDGIQAAKAGILEIGDVFAVNKADRPGADVTVRELTHMLALGRPQPTGRRRDHRTGAVAQLAQPDGLAWQPPVVKTVASAGEGIPDLVAAIAAHHAWLASSGSGQERRVARARAEVVALAQEMLAAKLAEAGAGALLNDLTQQVASGECDPYAAADSLLASLRDHHSGSGTMTQ